MNLISITSDAMVNLNKMDIAFQLLGHGEYSAKLTDSQLDEFLKINECRLDFLGRIVDASPDFKGEKWGCAIRIEGEK